MLLPLLPTCVVRHVAQTAEIMDKDISQCSRYQFLQTAWFSQEALLEKHPYLDGARLGSLENHRGQENELNFFLHLAGSRACCVLCYLCSPAASLPPRLSIPAFIICYYQHTVFSTQSLTSQGRSFLDRVQGSLDPHHHQSRSAQCLMILKKQFSKGKKDLFQQ